MSDPHPRQDIDFVIAQGEALVERARSMVQQWEQQLLKAGITPEMAERLQQGVSDHDLSVIAGTQQGLAVTDHPPERPSEHDALNGPSLQSSRRAIRRLRHI